MKPIKFDLWGGEKERDLKHCKRILGGILAGVMIMATGISATAAEEHIYNRQVFDGWIENTFYSHTHYTCDSDGTVVPVNCVVTVNRYMRIMKCHCGEGQVTYYSYTHHSVN